MSQYVIYAWNGESKPEIYTFICILFKIWIKCNYLSLTLHTQIGWRAESHSYIPSVVNSFINWHHILVMCGWKLLLECMWMFFNMKYLSFLPCKTITGHCFLCLVYRMCWIVVKTLVIVINRALSIRKLESKSWIKALFLLPQTRSGFLWTCFILHRLNKKMTNLWIRLVQGWCLRDGQKVRSLDISLTLFQSFLLIFYVTIYLLHQYEFPQYHMIVASVLFIACIASLDWKISMFPRETLTTNFMTCLVATNNCRMKVVISTV